MGGEIGKEIALWLIVLSESICMMVNIVLSKLTVAIYEKRFLEVKAQGCCNKGKIKSVRIVPTCCVRILSAVESF